MASKSPEPWALPIPRSYTGSSVSKSSSDAIPTSAEHDRLLDENAALRSVRRHRPIWNRADTELPGEKDYRYCGCFGSPQTVVLVYNPYTDVLEQQPISKLKGQSATYEKLPSRFCSRLYIYLEDSSRVDTASAKGRVRITGSAKRFKGFRELQAPLSLKQLGPHTRLEILKGNIQWIFVLDYAGPSADSHIHPKPEYGTFEEKKRDDFLMPTSYAKIPTWKSDQSSSTDSSSTTKPPTKSGTETKPGTETKSGTENLASIQEQNSP